MNGRETPEKRNGEPQSGTPEAAPPRTALRTRLHTLLQERQSCSDAMVWLVSAIAAAPHVANQPATLVAVALLVWMWRAGIWLYGGRFPPRSLLFVLCLALAGLVLLEFGTFAGRDAGAALMIIMLGLKQLENNGRRDALIALYLSVFLFLTQFLREQSAFDLLWMISGVLLLQLAWIQLYYIGPMPRWRTQIALMMRLTMVGVPIMIVLFLLVPRLALPSLQSGLSDDSRAQVGFSGKMQFGSVTELGESNEIAFRVKFEADRPPPLARLYWRGAVLERHDGRDWHPAEPETPSQDALALPQAPPEAADAVQQRSAVAARNNATLAYTVELLPHQLDWLFALAPTQQAQLANGTALKPNAAGELRTTQIVRDTLRYSVISGSRSIDTPGSPAPATLKLAPWTSPRATKVAQGLAASATANLPSDATGVESSLLKLAALQQWMRDANLRYTLNAPALSGDLVDSFLFDTGAGFCEHFSASFAVMARAMGVPSRIVLGYQGGELNPLDGQITVLQRHAHAWAEVWVDGAGWMQVDPVSWVAPERIDRGLLAEQRQHSRLASLLSKEASHRLEEWRTRWRHIASAMRTGWNDWVLGYTLDRQQRFLNAVGVSPRRGALVALLLALVFGVPLLGFYLWRRFEGRHGADAADRAWRKFCSKLAAAGLPRASNEGPLAYGTRIRSELEPLAAQAAEDIAKHYARLKYGAPAANAEALTAALRMAVRQFRPAQRINEDRQAP